MSVATRISGKWHAARSLAQFVRYFRNWPEVWAAYRAGATVPPLVLKDGLTIHHGPGDDPIFLFRELFVEQGYTRGGFYEPRPGDAVLDLGANIGVFALYLQWRARGVRVHSFEPAAATRARLERNVRENGLDGSIAVHPFAVAAREGTVTLRHATLAGDCSLFERKENAGDAVEETVACLDLAGAVARTGVEAFDLLKIDVEGAEIEVVEGGDAATWGRIRRVAVEYHDLFRPGCRERVARALEGHGFRVEVVPDGWDPRLGLIRASR